MDGRRFDEFTRALAGLASRRGFLGGAGGAAAWLLAPRSADGACPPGQVRGARNRCLCVDTGRPATSEGCYCAASDTFCLETICCGEDGCVDLLTDPQHCGACGNVIATDRAQICCNGDSVQLGSRRNCAACGDDCRDAGDGYECCQVAEGFQCVPPGSCSGSTGTSTTTGTFTSTSLT